MKDEHQQLREHLDKMTVRDVFDAVKKHLLTQNRRASFFSDNIERCRYRVETEEGEVLKCAIGCLIPDDLYDKDFETNSIYDLRNEGIIPQHLIRILAELQIIHDVRSPADWRKSLTELSQNYNTY